MGGLEIQAARAAAGSPERLGVGGQAARPVQEVGGAREAGGGALRGGRGHRARAGMRWAVETQRGGCLPGSPAELRGQSFGSLARRLAVRLAGGALLSPVPTAPHPPAHAGIPSLPGFSRKPLWEQIVNSRNFLKPWEAREAPRPSLPDLFSLRPCL